MTTREMLAAAIGYALQGVALVTPASLDRPTPCAGWDLRTLLAHLTSSLAAIDEALGSGTLAPHVPPPRLNPDDDPVEILRDQAALLLVTAFLSGHRAAYIAGIPVSAQTIRGTGALEVAVHGWDVYAACGQHRPVPPGVAGPLLSALPALIPCRDGLFAGPVAAPPCAAPGDRLVAALGRDWTLPRTPLVTGE
jgi:uncharacterized protein (TIGR03086 family)